MRKDTTEFRQRFQRWKNGEQVYEAGLPKYNEGKDQDPIEIAVDFLAKNEGFVPNVYRDYAASQRIAKVRGKYDSVKGKYYIPTAGYGWTSKSDLHSWTKESAKERLKQDVIKYDSLLQNGPISNYANLNPYQKAAIIDLMHQGGTQVLSKMPKFVEAMNAGNYDKAYTHLAFNTKGTPNRSATRQNMFSRKYKVKSITTPVINKTISQSNMTKPVVKPLSVPTVTTNDNTVYTGRILQESSVAPISKHNELTESSTLFPPVDEFVGEWMWRKGILTPYQFAKNFRELRFKTDIPKYETGKDDVTPYTNDLIKEAVNTGIGFIPIVGTLNEIRQFIQEPSLQQAGFTALSAVGEFFPLLKGFKVAKNATKATQSTLNIARAAHKSNKIAYYNRITKNMLQIGTKRGKATRAAMNHMFRSREKLDDAISSYNIARNKYLKWKIGQYSLKGIDDLGQPIISNTE